MLHKISHKLSVLLNFAFIGFIAYCFGVTHGLLSKGAVSKEVTNKLISVK